MATGLSSLAWPLLGPAECAKRLNKEILQFPALLEHARGDTRSRYTPFLQGHPNPETDHHTFWVIPILIRTLLHQVIPHAEVRGGDRRTRPVAGKLRPMAGNSQRPVEVRGNGQWPARYGQRPATAKGRWRSKGTANGRQATANGRKRPKAGQGQK